MSRATMRPCGPEPRKRERSIPASLASRRASGVTATPPGSLAAPKLRLGVRTSKNGSSLIGIDAFAEGAAGAALAEPVAAEAAAREVGAAAWGACAAGAGADLA